MKANTPHPYFSQYGQDEILDHIFKYKFFGFFLDIGAHDGISYSNSYFFEKYRHYSGLCFEPNPDVYFKLKNNRKCECIKAAISDKTEIVKFTKGTGYTEMLSGITNFRENKHIARVNRDISIHGGEITEIEVQAFNLNEILNQRNIIMIDFLSIDIEGGELVVLKSIDFKKIHIKAIIVEINFPEIKSQISNYLRPQGFRFLCNTGSDGIYINISDFDFFNPILIRLVIIDRLPSIKAWIAQMIGYNKWKKYLRR